MKNLFKRSNLIGIGAVLFFALLFLYLHNQAQEKQKALQRKQFIRDSIARMDSLKAIEDAKPKYKEGSIGEGQGIFQVLDSLGVPNNENLRLINALRFQVELTGLRVGEYVAVRFNPSDSSQVLELIYRPNPSLEHRLIADSTGQFLYEHHQSPLTRKYRLVFDTLQEGSTLDQMLANDSVRPSLAQVVNGTLLCKISFRTDARKGDIYRALLEEDYFGDQYIDGSVLYASYRGALTGFHEVFRYREDDPKSSYNAHYTEDGEALIHSGLRYPLDRLHVSSPYGARIHPVTGRRSFHHGIDYAAKVGTPVYAVAPGTVVKSSYDKLSGNLIAIRHADQSKSYYMHLSRRLVGAGVVVRSHQLIGKVGATGRVTGPHLHFGFRDAKGSWMNPGRKRMIATPKLQGKRLERLHRQVDSIRTLLAEQDKNLFLKQSK